MTETCFNFIKCNNITLLLKKIVACFPYLVLNVGDDKHDKNECLWYTRSNNTYLIIYDEQKFTCLMFC